MAYGFDYNLLKGYKEFEAKVKNLEGIFRKLDSLFDISKYKVELSQIKKDLENETALSNSMSFEGMQLTYERFVLTPYNTRLDKLTQKIEEELLPYYEIHLLSSKIDALLPQLDESTINQFIDDNIELVKKVNKSNTHKEKELDDIIKKAYETIYSSILHEEMLDRNDILKYILKLDIPVNQENLGRLIEKDLKLLRREDIVKEDLRNLKKSGLGYDFINEDLIKKISLIILSERSSNFQNRKMHVIEELNDRARDYKETTNLLVQKQKENKQSIKGLSIKRNLVASKVLSFVLIPVLSFGGLRLIGTKMSNNINEYKTITRTVNPENGNIVGNVSSIYDEKETTYAATVKVYTSWQKNPTGVGYVRNVVAYEYIAPENLEEGYHATKEDLEGNTKEKYRYVESKDVLNEEDSTEDALILITETYQDKSDFQKSTKFILPFSIIGAFLGIAIDVLLAMAKILDIDEIKEEFERLNNKIKRYNLDNDQIKQELLEMKSKAELILEDYDEQSKKYGLSNYEEVPLLKSLDRKKQKV